MIPNQYRRRRRTGESAALEKDFADFLDTLAGPQGILTHGLTVRDNMKCRLYPLTFTCPDDWVPVTLLNGFSLFGAPQFGAPAAVRSDWGGACEARAAVRRVAGAPSSGTQLFQFPDGYQVRDDGDRRCPVDNLGATGACEVLTAGSAPPNGGVSFVSGSAAFIDLSGVRWLAKGGCPPWPLASQPLLPLGDDFPGLVERVEVLHAVTPAGLRRGPCGLMWTTDTLNGKPALRLRRIEGLVPGQKYTLLVAAFAA